MKRILLATTLATFISPMALAEAKFQVGGGLASQVVGASYDYYSDGTRNEGDLTLSNAGLQIAARALVNKHLGVDVSYARMGNGDSTVEISSGGLPAADRAALENYTSHNTSANFLIGLSMTEAGWYGYTGIGAYHDKWTKSGSESYTFSGLQIPVGGGYNFSWGTIDLQLALKESSEYDDFMRDQFAGEENPDTLAASFRASILASF